MPKDRVHHRGLASTRNTKTSKIGGRSSTKSVKQMCFDDLVAALESVNTRGRDKVKISREIEQRNS